MASNSETTSDKQERLIELNRQLAAKRAKVEELDSWAQNLQEEGEASAQRAEELRQRIDALEQDLEDVKAAPDSAWEDAQCRIGDMWNDLSKQVDELVSRIDTKDIES